MGGILMLEDMGFEFVMNEGWLERSEELNREYARF
jgi:hypothetical protein